MAIAIASCNTGELLAPGLGAMRCRTLSSPRFSPRSLAVPHSCTPPYANPPHTNRPLIDPSYRQGGWHARRTSRNAASAPKTSAAVTKNRASGGELA
jgi:hypothetical protein